MLDNLKSQAYQSLKHLIKILQLQSHQENQQLSVTNTQEAFLESYSNKLETHQRVLINMMLKKDLQIQCSKQYFTENLNKILTQMQFDNNQFKPQNISIVKNPIKKIILNKLSNPSIDYNLEYFRVNFQLCNKLFEIYKQFDISKNIYITFQDKVRQKNSLSYHKILYMLKQIKVELDVTQKLQLLRSIKKYSFNQNFINRDQFLKIFKYIIHGMGFKQQEFYKLVNVNYKSNQSLKSKDKNFNNHSNKRNIRIKTQIPLQSIKSAKLKDQPQYYQTTKMNEQKIDKKQSKKLFQNEQSYLVKAIQKKNFNKITWQVLFNMTEQNRHHQVIIPDFIPQSYNE